MQGARNHGIGLGLAAWEIEHAKANAPQKKINTAAEMAIFSAAARPNKFPNPLSAKSKRTLFD